jgi:hypothetical protein
LILGRTLVLKRNCQREVPADCPLRRKCCGQEQAISRV